MSLAAAALARMQDRILAHFGEAAVLRGAEPVVVAVSENVEIVGDYGQVVQLVTTATFPAATAPRPGDALALRAQSWVIENALRGDSQVVEHVIREATA